MKTNHIYFVILLFLVITGVKAQQDPNYILYRYAMNIVNPAYAGAEARTEFAANIRSQWSGVEGAPENQSLMASTFLGKKVGLGVSIVNDKTFIETQTSLAIDFSYKVQWDDVSNIYFGLKASGNSYNVNTAGLTTFGIDSDPSLMNIDGGFTPNVGAGIYFQNRKLALSFSTPKVLRHRRLEQEGSSAKLGSNKIHMYLMGAYDMQLDEKLLLKPSAMLRYVENAPLSIDLTLALNYNEIFEFGAAYRWSEGLAGYFLINLANDIYIGYGYEASLESALATTNNGTHEIFIKFRL